LRQIYNKFFDTNPLIKIQACLFIYLKGILLSQKSFASEKINCVEDLCRREEMLSKNFFHRRSSFSKKSTLSTDTFGRSFQVSRMPEIVRSLR